MKFRRQWPDVRRYAIHSPHWHDGIPISMAVNVALHRIKDEIAKFDVRRDRAIVEAKAGAKLCLSILNSGQTKP